MWRCELHKTYVTNCKRYTQLIEFQMNIKDEVCSFGKLYKAMKKCSNGVKWKDGVIRYTNNGLANIYKLRHSVLEGKYKISKYNEFDIFEPKKRHILSTRFKDRVFQRSLIDNYAYHEMTRHFIPDNMACQRGKGTTKAIARLVEFLHAYYRKNGLNGYYVKIDIKNFFPSTSHKVAYNAVKKRVPDEWACSCFKNIIDSYNNDGNARGLGLGSATTQLMQLAVLDDIEHFVKERLRVKHYLRYMDDLLFIRKTSQQAHCDIGIIRQKLDKIELRTNDKKTKVCSIKKPIHFLGFSFRLTETGHIIIKPLRKRQYKTIRHLRKLYALESVPKWHIKSCVKSCIAHTRRGNTVTAERNIIKKNNIFKEQFYEIYKI